MMVALASLARILENCSAIHSLPVLFFFFLGGDLLAHTNPTC